MRIVLTRQKIHGHSVDEYAAALRDRLPDHDIVVARTPDEEREAVTGADVVTGEGHSMGRLLGEVEAPDLKLFAGVYAGTGHLDLDAFREAGVAVTNASGVHAPNIAEYVVGALVSLARDFRRATRQQDRREWRAYQTRELKGSTVTVVGVGSIGEAILQRLEPFGVERLAVRHSPEKGGPAEEVVGFDGLHDALARTDHLVLACPLTDETEGLIDADALRTLPPEATLVNIARGAVVDTDALVSAFNVNDLGAAFLDVTDPEPLPEEHPLWGFEDVRITPHNAGHTPAYFGRLVDIVAENVERIAGTGETGELRNRVV
ncbi:D-2-hydroxyacid dehydrogenase [Candidatus Halobonum tyrrellensis]|uniref:Glyoxylate reductase n=1 Tax=Candidatus Halobonum tyrrellensis G22 TaxID=1324957 RepID=V4HMB3_9EURY|nr:D-2-hydroxyacid dehydrogenase [Candidatus Halobonum tyrrellensis]ESP89069.1 glyoxylate reductase [Candidatus Halobonum tyrrellensis G22]